MCTVGKQVMPHMFRVRSIEGTLKILKYMIDAALPYSLVSIRKINERIVRHKSE